MPTQTISSPGSYYHQHIKPKYRGEVRVGGFKPLDPVYATYIPSTAVYFKADSGWLIATEYDSPTSILTIWIQASKKSQLEHDAEYHGMRFSDVPYSHVGGLHSGNSSDTRELTDKEIHNKVKISPKSVKYAKARQIKRAEEIRKARLERAKRGFVVG